MNITEAEPYKEGVIKLLAAEKLPVDDLPSELVDFFVVVENDSVTGVAGLEIYGDFGLLRSVAVERSARGLGISAALLDKIETVAFHKGLQAILLLTETAAGYFAKKGYVQIARMDIPADIKASSQFNHVCPQSAIAMQRTINP